MLSLGYTEENIYRNLSIIDIQLKDYKKAEGILLEMKKQYPKNYKCYIQLALLYLELESNKSYYIRNYDKVLENYKLALKYCDNSNDLDLSFLKEKIASLKENNWIKEDD